MNTPKNKELRLSTFTFAEMMDHWYPVSSGTLAALENEIQEWSCRKHDIISAQGKLCSRWIFISSGICRISIEKNGKEDTLVFGRGGDVFTSFHSIVSGERSPLQLQALTDCQGWWIAHERYGELQERYPDLIKWELCMLRRQIRVFEDYYAQRALSTPQERFAMFWKKNAAKLNILSPHMLSKFIPLKIIAQYLSMTPVMLSILRRRAIERARNNKPR